METLLDGPGHVGEEPRHLLRALQMPLALRRQPASGVVDVGVVACAGQHVVERLVARCCVAHAVGRHQRQVQRRRQLRQRAVALLFLSQPVTLQLHVHVSREQTPQVTQQLARLVQAARRETVRHQPLIATRQTMQTRHVLPQQPVVHASVSLGASLRRRRQQLAKVLVTLAAAHQQRQPPAFERPRRRFPTRRLGFPTRGGSVAVRQHDLRPHQRPNPRLLCRLVEAGSPIHARPIRQSHRRQTQSRRPRHQVLRLRRAVEKRERRRHVQLRIPSGTRRRRIPPLPNLLLARARRRLQVLQRVAEVAGWGGGGIAGGHRIMLA